MRQLPRRAALYARVSTSAQDHRLQVRALRAWAKSKGLGGKAVDEVLEVGSGGGRLELREKLLEDCRARRYAFVVVWKLDRLGRSVLDVLEVVEKLRCLGVELVSVTEGLDTSTAPGRLVLQVLAVLAEFERELIRERQRAGIDAARARGVRFGRPCRSFSWGETKDLLERTGSIRATARRLKISRSTLARRVAQNPVFRRCLQVGQTRPEKGPR